MCIRDRDMAVLISLGHQLVHIVDFPYRGDGVASQMGLDQQGLRFVVGNAADAEISLQLLQIPVKFRAEGRVLDVYKRQVLRRELAVVQCGVVAALSQQFLVVSNFLDVPVLHVDDQLRVLDGG